MGTLKKILFAAALISASASAPAISAVLNKHASYIVQTAALTAAGRLDELSNTLEQALNSGLTINELNEVLIQLYAYAGFPRSLNGINTFMHLVEARQKAGIRDVRGPEASPLQPDVNKDELGAKTRAKIGGRKTIPAPAGYQLFAPAIDTFLKEHLFCDIINRDNLPPKERELATVAVLAALGGVHGQLRFHINGALNTGSSPEELKEITTVLKGKIPDASLGEYQTVLEQVLKSRQK